MKTYSPVKKVFSCFKIKDKIILLTIYRNKYNIRKES